MRSIHFDVQGFHRTYWDLFVAAGFSVGVLYLFAAILAWQLGGLPAATLALMRGTAWTFALCFAAITVVSWSYLFIYPHRFLNRDYIMFDCGSMAFNEAGFRASIAIVYVVVVLSNESSPRVTGPLWLLFLWELLRRIDYIRSHFSVASRP